MSKINLADLTPEQRQEMLAELKAAEENEKNKRQDDIKSYKALVSETVDAVFPTLEGVSAALAQVKRDVRGSFKMVTDFKAGLFGQKEGQISHQFMNEEGNRRIRLGYHTLDNYDDTVDVGIGMVEEYINSLATDEKSQMLVSTVLKLLSKDAKGTLKASRVLQLQQLADKSGDAGFMEGVKIIRDAYKPIESKSYIRAEYKDENGAWKSIPLGMTEAE